MHRKIQLGDVVKIIDIGPTSTLSLGAIVTIRRMPAPGSPCFTVQAESADSYQDGYAGWSHTEFGDHCHNVYDDEIELMAQYHKLPTVYNDQAKIPFI